MGMFFTKENKPYFSPKGLDEGVEIKTEKTPGIEIKVYSADSALYPNIYYLFGFVESPIVISRLFSYSKTHLEIYAGEFTIVEGGSVQFPSTIKWVEEPVFEEGYTYQFEIKNGIGHFLKVK